MQASSTPRRRESAPQSPREPHRRQLQRSYRLHERDPSAGDQSSARSSPTARVTAAHVFGKCAAYRTERSQYRFAFRAERSASRQALASSRSPWRSGASSRESVIETNRPSRSRGPQRSRTFSRPPAAVRRVHACRRHRASRHRGVAVADAASATDCWQRPAPRQIALEVQGIAQDLVEHGSIRGEGLRTAAASGSQKELPFPFAVPEHRVSAPACRAAWLGLGSSRRSMPSRSAALSKMSVNWIASCLKRRGLFQNEVAERMCLPRTG